MPKVNLCLDIETIRATNELKEATEQTQAAWINFAKRRYPDTDPELAWTDYAGLYPEFGRIVCISVLKKNEPIKSFWLEDAVPENNREKVLLQKFTNFVGIFPYFRFVGHNITKFDLPYIIVRLVGNGMKLPKGFRLFGLKPWEIDHWDTMNIWTQGVWGSSQAKGLEPVCNVLKIQSPKAEFSGAQVSDMYYSGAKDRIEQIVKYCERDTLATALALAEMANYGMFDYKK